MKLTKNLGGRSEAVWNFSENSSVLVPSPYRIAKCRMRQFYIKVRKCHHKAREEVVDFKSKKGHFVSTGDALVLPD